MSWRDRLRELNTPSNPDAGLPLWRQRLNEVARSDFERDPGVIFPEGYEEANTQEEPGLLDFLGAKANSAWQSAKSGAGPALSATFEQGISAALPGGEDEDPEYDSYTTAGQVDKKEVLRNFGDAIRASQEEQAITERYKPNFIEELAGDAIGSIPSLVPLAASAATLAATRNPAAAAAAAAATAPLPASQVLFQSFSQAKIMGLSDEAAVRYALKQGGAEQLLESIPVAKLAKTFAGSVIKRAAREGMTEMGTELASIDVDLADLPEAAPKTFGEGAERVAKAGLLGSIMGGAVVTLPTAAEFKAGKLPKTGDSAIDAGIDAASKAAEQILGDKPKTAAPKEPEQLKLFKDPELKQGSLFGAEFDVDPATAEANRAASQAAMRPEEILLSGDGAGNLTGTAFNQPQTTLEQALAAAAAQETKQAEKAAQSQERIDNKRSYLAQKNIKQEAKQIAGLAQTEEVIRRKLREKYPEAFSGQTTTEAIRQQALAAAEYDAIRKAIPKVAPGVIRDQRLNQLQRDERLLEGRQVAADQEARNRAAIENQVAPVQGELTPAQGDMFPQETIPAPTTFKTRGGNVVSSVTGEVVTPATAPAQTQTAPVPEVPTSVAAARAALGKSNEVSEFANLDIVTRQRKESPQITAARRKLLVEKVKNGADAAKYLNSVVKDETSKRLVTRLMNIPSLKDVPVQVLNKADIKAKYGKVGLGGYSAKDNSVYLRDNQDIAADDVHGVDDQVLLHELAHAATAREMNNVADGKATSVTSKRAYQELTQILGKLQKHFASEILTPAEKNLTDRAFQNEKELVAYMYTDPQLQGLVREKAKPLWRQWLDTVARFFGYDPKNKIERDFVERILTLSDQIMDVQSAGNTQASSTTDSMSEPYKPDPNAVADDLVFNSVIGNKGSTQDVDRTEAGGGEFIKWFRMALSPYGIRSKKFSEISEATQGVIQSMLAEEQAAKVRMDNIRHKLDYKSRGDEHTPEGIKRLLAKEDTKPLGLEMQAMRERYKTAALALADEFLIGRQTISKKDLAVAKAIRENLDDYLSRAYAVDINQRVIDVPGVKTVGEQYVENVVEAWKRGKTAEAGDPIFKSRFYVRAKNAVDFFRTEVLGFREGWEENMEMSTLQKRYKLLMGHAYSPVDPETLDTRIPTLKRETMVKEIKAILPETKELLDQKAEQLMYAVLGADENGNKVDTSTMAFYRGRNSIDRTILTPRKDVPWAISELWGEIKDPFDAMFITMQRLANTLSKTKMMRHEAERGLREGWLFPAEKVPAGTKFNKQIKGADFGALNGLYTTDAYFTQLEAMTKADVINNAALDSYSAAARWAMGAFELASKGARWTKWADVVLTPDNYFQNVVGSPVNLIMNGNFNAKTWLEGAKAAKQIVYDMRKGNATELSLQSYKANILDSALVGELKAEFNRGVYKDVLDDFLRDYDKSVADRVKRAISQRGVSGVTKALSAREVLTDLYAMMDLWTKIANFRADYKRLGEFSKRNGLNWDDDKLVRMAGFRTRNTNLSQQRAAGIVKGLERAGLTMYMTYHYEMYRTSGTNILVALNDIKQGLKYGDKQWTAHGVSRLVGATSAITFNTTGIVAQQLWKAGLLGWLGASAMDDDNMDKIMKALGPFGLGRTLIPAGTDGRGNPVFLDAGRSNPVEPVNGPIKSALTALARGEGAEKAVDDALASIGNLYGVNSMWKGIFHSIFNPTKTTGLERNNPESFASAFEALSDLGLDPDTANRILLAVEQPLPRELTALTRPLEASNANDPAHIKWLTAAGHPVVKFDVERQARFVAQELSTSTNSLRQSLLDSARSGRVPSKEDLEETYLHALTEERKAFQKVVDYVEGAKAAGFQSYKIRKFLAEQNVNADVISGAMRGKFRSNLVTDRFTDRLDTWEQDKAAKFADKAKAQQARRELERMLNGLSNKYRNFTGEEN